METPVHFLNRINDDSGNNDGVKLEVIISNLDAAFKTVSEIVCLAPLNKYEQSKLTAEGAGEFNAHDGKGEGEEPLVDHIPCNFLEGDFQLALKSQIENELIGALLKSKGVLGILSEFSENIIQGDVCEGSYIVYLSPIDCISNASIGLSCGTAFTISRINEPDERKTKNMLLEEDILSTSADQIEITGYTIYGCRTELVLAVKNKGVHRFILDRSINLFLLHQSNLEIPKKGKFYSINESTSQMWENVIKEFIKKVKTFNTPLRSAQNYKPGGVIPVLHGVLLKGGIYIDPPTLKEEGETPFLFHGYPIGFIMEEAGGLSCIDSRCKPILEYVPTRLKEKTGIFFGSYDDVNLLSKMCLHPKYVLSHYQ